MFRLHLNYSQRYVHMAYMSKISIPNVSFYDLEAGMIFTNRKLASYFYNTARINFLVVCDMR